MAEPFDGFTDKQADAIHEAIAPYLKPDIDWDRELEEITEQIDSICEYAQVLYKGDNQRHLKSVEALLKKTAQAYAKSPSALQWHINRQGFDHFPGLDDKTSPDVGDMLDALLHTVQQAQRRSFDAPHAYEQERGAKKKRFVLHQVVTHLISVFTRVTECIPTVYWSEHWSDHADHGYKGTAYPFLLACLTPLNLIPRKRLPSAVLAAYKQALPGIRATNAQLGGKPRQGSKR